MYHVHKIGVYFRSYVRNTLLLIRQVNRNALNDNVSDFQNHVSKRVQTLENIKNNSIEITGITNNIFFFGNKSYNGKRN